MADPIAAMLGLEIDDEEKTRALADSLRGRKRAADFFSVSTINPIAKGAQAEAGDVMASAEEVGGLRKALAEREATAERDRLKQAFDAEQQRKRLEATAEQGRLDRAADLESNQTLAGYGLKPAAKQVDQYNELTNLMGQVDSIKGMEAEFTKEQRDMADSPVADVGIGLAETILPDGASRIVEEAYYDDPKVREWQSKGTRLTSRVSQLASGMAVTGYEMKDRDKWSPWARGISLTERKTRLNNLETDFKRQQGTLYKTHRGYFNEPGWMAADRAAKDAEVQAAAVEAAESAAIGEVIDPYDALTDEEVAAAYAERQAEKLRRQRAEEARQMGATGQTGDYGLGEGP